VQAFFLSFCSVDEMQPKRLFMKVSLIDFVDDRVSYHGLPKAESGLEK